MSGVYETLNAAADLLEKPGAWTQGTFARDEAGAAIIRGYKGAVCWCALGALDFVSDSNPTWDASVEALVSVVAGSVAKFNDAPERTQAEVVAALRQAARQSKGAE